MKLSSMSTAQGASYRDLIGSRRRWPVSYSLPAVATTAAWLFITVWLPAGEMAPEQLLAPVAAAPAVQVSQADAGWPAPAVRDEAVVPAEPAPTF